MDREGEYAAALLCVGGPPARRPGRNLRSSSVDFSGMGDPYRGAYSTWAGKVKCFGKEQGWINHAEDLFPWITGFLKWFDSLEERYHG